MSNTTKNALYSGILIILMLTVYLYRQSYPTKPESKDELVYIQGITMGTVAYNIKYLDKGKRNFKKDLDSLFAAFNQSLSTYIPDSEISIFNKDSIFSFKSPFFYPVLAKSKEVFEKTGGAFDPTVAPLVNAWGFGFQKEAFPDSSRIDSLKKLIGFDKIQFDKKAVRKLQKGITLDFGAIAGGYIVDLAAVFLDSKNIQNYLVEIGGELQSKGKNQEGKIWLIGITHPLYKEKNQSKIFTTVELTDKAMTTSGNYEKFYIKDGKKYAHTIHPKTGYPVISSLLSATVFAEDCMTADAFATAFMVLGLEESKKILTQNTDLDAYLIYADEKGDLKYFVTKGMEKHIRKTGVD